MLLSIKPIEEYEMQLKIVFARIVKNKSQISWDWSGSVNGVENALKKKHDVIEYRFFWDISMKIHKLLQKMHLIPYDFETYNLVHINKKVNINNFQFPIIQFDEFPNNSYLHSYIYQDLSVMYINKIALENSREFLYSGFGKIKISAIKKRMEVQRDFYNNAYGIFTMSHWLYNYLLNEQIVPEEKLCYVGGGVNLDVSKVDPSIRKGNKILFVGKDFLRKGGDLVYEAFCILNTQINPNTELYIIGPKKSPISIYNENVHFLGEKTSEEIVEYFNICDIFVMPSRFEAYGLVFIEALTFGLPCIGRNSFEMPYFIEEGVTGHLIDTDDPLNLAKKMQSLLKDDKIKSNVLERRQEYIQEYSWDTVCDRMLTFINNIEK
jgi:glycosyltransferase involved in cell wall biosynthesis